MRAEDRIYMEEWRSIPSFPKYEVSVQGIIRNKGTKKIMSVRVDNKGYLQVSLVGNSYPNRKVHILVVLDEGVTTMFDKDEKGNSGWKISEMSLHSQAIEPKIDIKYFF